MRVVEESSDVISVIDSLGGNVLDKLPPNKRDIVETVASAVMWKILYRMNNFMRGIAKQLETRGVIVDTDLRVDRTRRGAVATVRVELKDINPRLMIMNRKYILKTLNDKWLKWALVKILAEIAEEEVDEAFMEGLDVEFNLTPKVDEKVIVGRISLE